eukprot:scaffold87167_cov56-Attheya_sp.AAC.8
MRGHIAFMFTIPLRANIISRATLRKGNPHQRFTNQSLRSFANMGWENTWDDILSGGHPRWKVDDIESKQIALNHLTNHGLPTSSRILCPLAGDDPFVHFAWKAGHHVTAIDLVPKALAAMRAQFGSSGSWTQTEGPDDMVVWSHDSGRATQYQGNAFTVIPELKGTFDAVYDKDSFGALQKSMRGDFYERIADYTKDNAIIYIEVKLRAEDHPNRDAGPPFSVEKHDLMEPNSFGKNFEYVATLGEVYNLSIPKMKQTGHVLKRTQSL